jgi:hypothetical protein
MISCDDIKKVIAIFWTCDKIKENPINYMPLKVLQVFQYGAISGTFTHLKWSLISPDFKECWIRYS